MLSGYRIVSVPAGRQQSRTARSKKASTGVHLSQLSRLLSCSRSETWPLPKLAHRLRHRGTVSRWVRSRSPTTAQLGHRVRRFIEVDGPVAQAGKVASGGVTGSPGYGVALLHSNVRDGFAQWNVRDLQQARERTVEFQDQEDRP